jgi:hypothetical protein
MPRTRGLLVWIGIVDVCKLPSERPYGHLGGRCASQEGPILLTSQSEQESGMACKQPGCPEIVKYVPMIVPGALKKTLSRGPRERTIYLRCLQGHVYPYRVIG